MYLMDGEMMDELKQAITDKDTESAMLLLTMVTERVADNDTVIKNFGDYMAVFDNGLPAKPIALFDRYCFVTQFIKNNKDFPYFYNGVLGDWLSDE
jgi:hypothetical protein